jgi:SulP family sulfate permease
MPRPEVAIMLIVLILSAVWNLVFAVGIGLIIASLIFMKKIGDLTTTQSKIEPFIEEKPWADESDFPRKLKEEVFIKHINGPLFFGSTSDFQQLVKQIPNTASVIVIRMKKMEYMDQSGLYAIEDVLMELVKNGKTVLLTGIPKQPLYMMERVDIIPDLIPRENIFENFSACLNWIKENVKDK